MKRFIFGVLLFINCAYYNTFYNAEKYYEEGFQLHKEGKSGDSFFQKSIEKCNKMIARYQGSEWMDDAIFLLGKNYYFLNQHSKASANFRKIIDSYQDSPFYSESMLFLGKILMEEGRYTEAIILLDRAADSGNLQIKMEAFKTKIEIKLRSDSPEEAIVEGKEFIDKYGAHKSEIFFIMGNAYSRIEDYNKALDMYKKSMNSSKELKPKGLSYRLARVYMELDSLNEALNVIGEYKGRDSTTVLKGEILRKMGRNDEAEEVLNFAKNWRNELGAVANYEMGLLKENDGDLEEAKKLYSKTIEIGKSDRISDFARARRDILILLSELNPDTTGSDSTKYQKDPAYIYFRIGELYYIDINDKENAIYNYEKVYKDFPMSPYAPKALYVLANLFLKEFSDSSNGSLYLSKLLDNYPKTDFSKRAMEEFSDFLPDTSSN
jgi:tetratricopeptide (TPR) repeat protein